MVGLGIYEMSVGLVLKEDILHGVVWCDIINDVIIEAYFIKDTLNGLTYAKFVSDTLSAIREELLLKIRMLIWF